MLVEFEDRILLTRLPRGPKLCGLYVPPVKMRDTAASYRRPAAGTASTKVRFARTGTPVSTGSVASVSAVLGGVAAGAETTLVAIGTVGVGRAYVIRYTRFSSRPSRGGALSLLGLRLRLDETTRIRSRAVRNLEC